MPTVVVEFLRDNAPYRKGDAAGFPADRAELFVAARAAKVVRTELGEDTVDRSRERPLPVGAKVIRNGSRKG